MKIEKRRFSDQLGMTLFEVMISLGISAIFIVAMASAFSYMSSLQAQEKFLTNLAQMRLTFQNLALDSQAWSNTVRRTDASGNLINPGMSCLYSTTVNSTVQTAYDQKGSLCSVADGGPLTQDQGFVLYDQTPDQPVGTQKSIKVFDGSKSTTALTNGMTLDGRICDASTGQKCAILMQLIWRLQCNLVADPYCAAPSVVVKGIFSNYTGPGGEFFNYENYNWSIVRPSVSLNYISPCSDNPPNCGAVLTPICTASGWRCESFIAD